MIIILLLLWNLLVWVPLTVQAATLDNSCSGGTNAGTSASCTMTIGSLTNGVLLIFTCDRNATDTQTTPTVGGSSTGMTLQDTQFQDVGTNDPCKLWYLVNPPSGSQAIAFTATSSSLAIAAITYSGVNQSTPLRTVGKVKGSSAGPTATATTVDGDTVAGFFAWTAGGTTTLTYDASQTSRQNRPTNTQGIGIDDRIVTGTTNAAFGTLSSAQIWAVITAPIINVAGVCNGGMALLGVGGGC